MLRPAATLAMILAAATLIASTAIAAERATATIDDTARFSPAGAISSAATTDAATDATSTIWRKVNDPKSPSGWRLETTVKTKAPDLALPLDVKGPHEIHIGVHMPDTLTSGVLVRTDDDPYFHYIKGWCDEKYPAYHQTFYKVADCTGRKLIFRQPAEMRSYITHVKLVPRDEIPKLPEASREVLGLSCTFHHFIFYAQHDTAATAASIVRAHELCGFTEMVFCCGRSCLSYETKIGSPNRIKLSGRLSMNCHYHGSYSNKLTSDFVLKNPHFHDKRRNGSIDNHKLCYGYPEVRAERVAILREIVELGCGHLFIDCRRYMPMTQWGDPLVKGFQKKYGVDPRKLKNTDKLWPAWLRYRASFFTQVLQDTKNMLAEIGRDDVTVTIRVNAEPLAKNLEHGAEVGRFVEEGLVDRIVLGEKDCRPVVKEYLELVRGTNVKVIGCLSVHGPAMAGPEHHSKGDWPTAMYRTPDYAHYAKVIDDLYDMGVHGIAFYETDEGCLFPRMRELFIACHRPETIKAYRAKLE